MNAVDSIGGLFDDVIKNGTAKRITLCVDYVEGDHFEIDTDVGAARVSSIVFQGDLSLIESLLPLISTQEYRHSDSGELISQTASFAPLSFQGKEYSTEFHKVADSGETHIILRNLSAD